MFVVPDTLATPQDLTVWTGQPAPGNAVQLLRSASSLVLEATSADYYDVDPATGLATDPSIGNTLRDATCVQAAYWAALSIDPVAGGEVFTAPTRAKKIGTASIDYDTTVVSSVAGMQARRDAASTLCSEALRKLELNNLLNHHVWTYG